jgi:ATP-dependent DNA ligase
LRAWPPLTPKTNNISPVPGIQFGGYTENRGKDLFQLAKEKGLEGIIAKRKTSIYRPGKRAPDRLKIKSRPQQEFVVCGFMEGKGSRKHFGALLLWGIPKGKVAKRALKEAIGRLKAAFHR